MVCMVPGPQGCARVPPGAVRERFGELLELRNRLSGSFRSSQIGSQSPLSDRFGGMLDFKAVRWHCGAHAMAENTESHEKCSTLSTNALDVRFFFQGRRMWPLARKSADPVGRVGSWRKRAPSSRSSVEELFSRAWGEVSWGTDRVVAAPGVPLGDVQSAAARTLPGAFRGAGRARARPGCASGRPGEFSGSQKRFRVLFSTLEALLSTHLGSSESSTSLGSSKVDRS